MLSPFLTNEETATSSVPIRGLNIDGFSESTYAS
jgi:hypothetical protein